MSRTRDNIANGIDRLRKIGWKTWAGLILVVAPLTIGAIFVGSHPGRNERVAKGELDQTLGEQLELGAEFIREHGRQLAYRANVGSAQMAAAGHGPGSQSPHRLFAFSELHLIANLRPGGTIVPIRSRLNAEDLRTLRGAIKAALETAGPASPPEPYRVVKLPSGLFLVGFHPPAERSGKDGLLLGVPLAKEVLDHFRAFSAVEIGFFWHRPHSAISPFQFPAERCQDCHAHPEKSPRPSAAFTARRSFKSETFYARSFPDGFRYGFMKLEMAGQRVAMLVARKPDVQIASVWSDIFAPSSAPAAGLLLAMLAAGSLLLRGSAISLRDLTSSFGLSGRRGSPAASGIAVQDRAESLVEGFRAVVDGAADSKERMDQLVGHLQSIVEAQDQEAAEAEGRLGGLLDASRSFAQISDGEELAEMILRRGAELTRARWGRLTLLLDEEKQSAIFDLTPAGKVVRLGEGSEQDSVSRKVMQSARPLLIPRGEAMVADGSFGGEEPRSGFMIAAPLTTGERIIGAITLCERRGEDEFKRHDADTLSLLANQAALALDCARIGQRAQKSYLQTIFSLVNAIEAKDPYLRGHSQRVTTYSVAIARELRYDDKGIDKVRIAAELHDVGKVGIDLSVLNKKGPLTAKEWVRLRRHPEVGRDIVRPLSFLQEVAGYILQHHERYNGSGYPAGLTGEQIALEARILAIADAFDAITSRRPYRPRRSEQEAILELRACAGTHFDPVVVEVAVRALTASG